MGKRWLKSVVWLGIWALVCHIVTPWGVYWWLGSAGILWGACYAVLRNTLRLWQHASTPPVTGTVVRRVILEEEVR